MTVEMCDIGRAVDDLKRAFRSAPTYYIWSNGCVVWIESRPHLGRCWSDWQRGAPA